VLQNYIKNNYVANFLAIILIIFICCELERLYPTTKVVGFTLAVVK
jgi:hypothetical protein